MFAWDIQLWYCCLNVRERQVLRNTVEGLLLTLWVGIPGPVWDAFWFGLGAYNDQVKSAFLSIYKLEIVTIEIDGEDLSVVRVRDGWLADYVSWSVFIFLPETSCPDGCQQSRVP